MRLRELLKAVGPWADPVFWAGLALTMILFAQVIHPLYPNSMGRLGHDYSYFLPRLLDGYVWWKWNGFLSIPWFTPSFCGGAPLFGNPQSMYFSLPQALTTVTDPMRSVYWTILAFAGIGYAGTYMLAVERFRQSPPAALTAAALFAFNGFFVYRMTIGHFAFHAFMLAPLTAYFLAGVPKGASARSRQFLAGATAGGLCIAYMIHSGMLVIGPHMALALAMLGLAHKIITGGGRFFSAMLAASAIGLALGGPKLVSAMAFMGNFPRDIYLYFRIPSLAGELWMAAEALFYRPSRVTIIGASQMVEGKIRIFETHYYEYGVTPLPALLALAALALWGYRRLTGQGRGGPSTGWLHPALLACALLFPLALNYDFQSPWLETVIAKIPIFSHQFQFLPWLAVYIPLLCVLSGWAVDYVAQGRAGAWGFPAAGYALIALVHTSPVNFWYDSQRYDPIPVMRAYYGFKNATERPAIHSIGYFDYRKSPREDHIIRDVYVGSDDMMAQGLSPLNCYEPVFGYNREKFAASGLVPGEALAEREGALNVTNPACYLFPAENQCQPGAPFPATRKEDAEKFLSYKPFPFRLSALQVLANAVFVVMLGLILAGGAYGLATLSRRRG